MGFGLLPLTVNGRVRTRSVQHTLTLRQFGPPRGGGGRRGVGAVVQTAEKYISMLVDEEMQIGGLITVNKLKAAYVIAARLERPAQVRRVDRGIDRPTARPVTQGLIRRGERAAPDCPAVAVKVSRIRAEAVRTGQEAIVKLCDRFLAGSRDGGGV